MGASESQVPLYRVPLDRRPQPQKRTSQDVAVALTPSRPKSDEPVLSENPLLSPLQARCAYVTRAVRDANPGWKGLPLEAEAPFSRRDSSQTLIRSLGECSRPNGLQNDSCSRYLRRSPSVAVAGCDPYPMRWSLFRVKSIRHNQLAP
jgi:hypothetical protein